LAGRLAVDIVAVVVALAGNLLAAEALVVVLAADNHPAEVPAVVEPGFDSVLHYLLAYYLTFAFQSRVSLLCIDRHRFDLAIF
jgi:hypothetical protein